MSKRKKDSKLLKKTNPQLDWNLGVLLGKGTFGEVYIATNQAGTEAAAKVCAVTREEDFIDLELEVQILTMCEHENVLKAVGSYYWEKKVWMIVMLCRCGALDDVIEKVDGLDEPTIKVILAQCLEGLEYLHKRCVIHRDIKAGNIMLTDDGVCKLADFGVSALMPSSVSRRNTFIGTPYWMAPEVIYTETFPHQEYDTKADIWSIGITAIELAQVWPPDCDSPPIQVMLLRMRSDPPTFSEPDLWSDCIKNFVQSLLVKDPSRRPSATQCLQLPFLTGEGVKCKERLVELAKMVLAIDHGDVENCEEETRVEIDLDDSVSDDSMRRMTPIATDGGSSQASARKVLRTIKKTIRVEVNGVTKTKTIIKVVDDEGKNQKEHERSIMEKLLNQMKVVKIAEQREQKKFENAHKLQRTELLARQKMEYDSLMDRYLAEADTLTKVVTREIEKKKAGYKYDLEKLLRKMKTANDKQRKTQAAAIKSKNKEKFEDMYFADDFVQVLQTNSMDNFIKERDGFKQDIIHCYMEIIRNRNERLNELLKNIIILRFTHICEISAFERSHLCRALELILQQKFKSDQKEITFSMKHMSEQEENMKREHARELRELPKQCRAMLKKNLETYRKSLKSVKNKAEKENLLIKKQDELISKIDSDLKTRKEQMVAQLKKLEESNARQLIEIRDYQADKKKAAYSSYQQQLFQKYEEDELSYKNELLKMYQLKKTRDQDYEMEVSVASTLDIGAFSLIKLEMF